MGVDYNGVAGIGFKILSIDTDEEIDEYLDNILHNTSFSYDQMGNGFTGDYTYYVFISTDIDFEEISIELERLSKLLSEKNVSFEAFMGKKLSDYFHIGGCIW